MPSPAADVSHSPRRAWRWYYTVLTATVLALAFVAFSDNLVTDVGQASNRIPRMVVHGLFALAWLTLLVVQSYLVASRRVRRHRALGTAAFVIGAGLVLSTGYLFYTQFRGFDAMPPYVLANRIFLPIFAVALVFAWRHRTLAAWHKRLLILGTALTLEPILSRATDRILTWGLPDRTEGSVDPIFTAAFAGTWTLLLVSHWLYDRKVLGRIHPVTKGATITLYGVFALVYLI